MTMFEELTISKNYADKKSINSGPISKWLNRPYHFKGKIQSESFHID